MPTRAPIFRPPGWIPAPRKSDEVHDPYYGTAEWKHLRLRWLRRDGFMCAAPTCTTPDRGKGGRLIAHHLIPRTKAGPDTLSNLQTRCPTCDAGGHPEKGRRG